MRVGRRVAVGLALALSWAAVGSVRPAAAAVGPIAGADRALAGPLRAGTAAGTLADTVAGGPVGALVEQVAGTTLYLRAGTSSGIAAGDTVAVSRDSAGAVIGRVTVIAATAARSVVTFAGAAFPVTRGQTLYLRLGAAAAAPVGAATPAPAARPAPRGAEAAVSGAPPGAPRGPTASGQVLLDLDVRRSVTTFGGGAPASHTRTFATPSLWLQTDVRDLPGGFSLDASARVSQRISSPSIVDPSTAPEIYEASLDKRFTSVPLDLRLGRFYSPYDPYGGYWDGVMLHYGNAFGGGVAAGFEPQRANQAPQGELPKVSAFLDYRSPAGSAAGYEGTVAFTAMRPTASSGVADHTFASVSQRIRLGRWYLAQDAQVDRGAPGSGWTLTRARLWASGPVTNILSLRAGLSRYRPYLYWMSDSVLVSYRRDEASGGFTLRLPGASIGADAGVDRDEGVGNGHSFSGYVGLDRITSLDLGFDASATWFAGGSTRVLTASAHFSRSFGRMNARLGYDLYRSRAPQGFWIMSHAADVGLDMPLGRGFRYSVLGQFRIGGGLGETRLYTSLSKSFGP